MSPNQAATVDDAVAALHLFRGLFNGSTKVNGRAVSANKGVSKCDPRQIEDALSLWEALSGLEKKLAVSFDPGADFPNEDARFFMELKTCLLDSRAVVWRHPFDHFHVGGFHSEEESVEFEKVIGKTPLKYQFLEGPIPATLLGTEFNLYSKTSMADFVATNIEWDDGNRESGEVYISDAPGKQWTLARLYITENDAAAL